MSHGGAQSRKRAASSEPAERTGYSEGLLIAALPVLHEPNINAAPVGAYLSCMGVFGDADDERQVIRATVEWDKNYYAAKSGEQLDTSKVLEGRPVSYTHLTLPTILRV